MSEDLMNYPQLVQESLRLVARRALERAAADGLPGAHHFYLSFRTDHAGVAVPGHLRERYPDEMTVVVQHQYWDLEAADGGFAVTLSFGGKQERIEVPWPALTAFYDPSVEFGVRFEAPLAEGAADAGEAGETEAGETEALEAPDSAGTAGKSPANVVSFDEFRKNK